MELVGPPGWCCNDVVGGDGQSTLTISSPGSPSPSASPFVARSAEAIIGHEASASVGSASALGCPLFGEFTAVAGSTCQDTKPPEEMATYLSSTAVRFTDPPGVAGDGAPSGGPYQADGAMTTYNLSPNDGVWVDTCTLPMSEQRVCGIALSAFLAKYGTS